MSFVMTRTKINPVSNSDASPLFGSLYVAAESAAVLKGHTAAGAPRVQSAVRDQIELRASDLDATLPVDNQARAVWAFVASLDLHALYARIKAVEGSRYSALGVPPSTRPS